MAQPLNHLPSRPAPPLQPRWRAGVLVGRVLSLLLLPCLLLLAALPVQASLLHLAGPIPADLGVQANGLAPCQSPAHCAFSKWPVPDAKAALVKLLPAVLALDGVELVETNADYLHATLTSRLFGFVDDLELFADAARSQIQARSQSRLGDSDLGVNARRLERLQWALLAAAPSPSLP
ncbi:MAG: hypothetical protein RLZZ609_2696 [Cyanobacteriota bacterium]|jgi:uncharacterized protein (DUF1499 family)